MAIFSVGRDYTFIRSTSIGADASADAKIRVGMGDAWEFEGPDADKNADKFIGDIQEQYSVDAVKENGGIIGRVGGSIYDAFAGPDIPDSHVKRYEGELDLSGSLSAGLSIGPQDPKGKHRKPDRHTEYKGKHRKKTTKDKIGEYDSRGSDSISPNAKAYVGVDGNEKVVFEQNTKTGDSSATFMLKGEVDYGENHSTAAAQAARHSR